MKLIRSYYSPLIEFIFNLIDNNDVDSIGAILLDPEHNIDEIINSHIDGVTLLVHAVQRENPNPEIVHLLLANGANPDISSPQFQTPLMIASVSDNTEIVIQLLEFGADVNAQDSDGNTAFHMASFNNGDVLDMLIDNPNIDSDIRGTGNMTALEVWIQRWG